MDEIALVPYDPAWPAAFAVEAARLRAVLPPAQVTQIEHVGSTAISGMMAKPVIDIFIAVPDLAAAHAAWPGLLEPLGYAFWADNPRTDRLFFVRGLPPNGPRTHHVHACEPGPEFERHLAFRDHMRTHTEDAAAYLDLKRDLAARHHGDREAYTRGKDDFVAAIEAKIQGAQTSSPSSV